MELPADLRVRNYAGGSCVWASLGTLGNWLELEGLAELNREVSGGAWPDRVRRVLNAKNIDYVMEERGRPAFLDRALATRRGAAVTWHGAHMVTLVYLDDSIAGLVDNNRPSHVIWQPRQEFLEEWRRCGGWAVTLVYTPPPPKPIVRRTP